MIPLTRAIPERIRGGYNDALYKLTFTFGHTGAGYPTVVPFTTLLYFTSCM